MTSEELDNVEVPGALGAIDLFLDGELVDAFALEAALASEDGRQYLIDVVSLREAAEGRTRFAPVHAVRTRGVWLRSCAAAAALTIAAASGYFAGRREAAPDASVTTIAASHEPRAVGGVAPKPTIVLTLDPGPAVDWKNTGSN